MECGRGLGDRGHPSTSERRGWREEALKPVPGQSPVLGQPAAAQAEGESVEQQGQLAGQVHQVQRTEISV